MKKSEREGLRPVSSLRVFLIYILLVFISIISTLIGIKGLPYSPLSLGMGSVVVLTPSLLVIYMLLSRYKRDFSLLDEKKRQIEKLYMVLNHVNHLIIEASTKDELFEGVCKILTSKGSFNLAWIGSFEEEGILFKPVAFSSSAEKIDPQKVISKFTRERVEIIKKSRTLVSEDVNIGSDLHSLASLPIKMKERVVAMLNIYSSRPFLEQEEIRLLQELAENISFGLENLQKDREITKLARAIEQTDDSIIITDKEGVVEYVNKAFEKITGYKSEEVVGKKANVLKSGLHDESFYRDLWATITSGKSFRAVFINRKKNGEIFYMEQTITPIKDKEGNIAYFVSTGKDITQQRIMETQINFLAYYDAVTNLPNRNLFMDRINQAIARAKHTGRYIAVAVLDLDNFKGFNDIMGHRGGDLLLREIADRLENAVRDGDTVARLGSDEFGILLVDISSEEIIPEVIRKITNVFSEPFKVMDKEFIVTVSMGVSVFPQDGSNADALIRNADVALSEAKELKGNSYLFFTEDMNRIMFEIIKLRTHLNEAIREGSLRLHYQPIVNLKTNRIEKVEALLRWYDKRLGNVSPAEFIPILEETGMIINVGEWVIKRACEQLRIWRSKGIDISISVNLSAIQLHRNDFVPSMERILSELLCDPSKLIFEITESALMKYRDDNIKKLEILKQMGFGIYLDDFGTGYASLSYLKQIPVDTLKVAGSFMMGVPKEKDDVAIVKSIANLAHSLGMGVIAEHVERKEQVEFLWEHEFHGAQGFYFSPPRPVEEVERIIINGELCSGTG